MIAKTKRAYAYANLTAHETEKLDEIAETLGYQSRTQLYTAAAHILIYGDAAELNRQNKRKTELQKRMNAFFGILDEMAFSVIAMRGIANINRTRLDEYCDEIRRQRYIEEEALA